MTRRLHISATFHHFHAHSHPALPTEGSLKEEVNTCEEARLDYNTD